MLASPRIRRTLFNTLFAGLIVLAGFLILRKHIDHDANGKLVVSSDVLAFVAAGDAMVHGSDLYYEASGAKTSYVYPPFYAFLNIPLTFIPPLAVDIGWFILNVVMFGAVLRMSYYLFTGARWAEQSYGRKVSLVLLVILCSLRYLIRNFQDANVNILVLFLIVFCFYQEKRGGGPWWAALVGIA